MNNLYFYYINIKFKNKNYCLLDIHTFNFNHYCICDYSLFDDNQK